MQWDRSASAAEPPSGRRRGRATALVVAELGLDEAALADALAWARGRVEEILSALDDAELRALLEPAEARREESVDVSNAAGEAAIGEAAIGEAAIGEAAIGECEPEPDEGLELLWPLDPSDELELPELPELPEPAALLPPTAPSLSPAETDVVLAQQRARMARRLVGNLVERSERLTNQLRRRDPDAAPPRPPRDEHRALVDEAMRLVADKRYVEAAGRLELALQRKPELRVRVLLCVVQARQALTERDFARARARYEAVLQLDPDNALAQRELLMLSALVR